MTGKMGPTKTALALNVQTFLTRLSGDSSLEIIWVKICYRQTDKFFETIYRGVDFFFKLNLLPPYSLFSQGEKGGWVKAVRSTVCHIEIVNMA